MCSDNVLGYIQGVLRDSWMVWGWFGNCLRVYLVYSGSVLGVFLRVYRWSTGIYWSVLRVCLSCIKDVLVGS